MKYSYDFTKQPKFIFLATDMNLLNKNDNAVPLIIVLV